MCENLDKALKIFQLFELVENYKVGLRKQAKERLEKLIKKSGQETFSEDSRLEEMQREAEKGDIEKINLIWGACFGEMLRLGILAREGKFFRSNQEGGE